MGKMSITYVDKKGKVLKKEKPVFKREEKPQENGKEEKKKSFISRFSGKNVEVKLITGDILTGIIEIDAYNKFDTILSNERGSFLVPKHSIVSMSSLKKERKRKNK